MSKRLSCLLGVLAVIAWHDGVASAQTESPPSAARRPPHLFVALIGGGDSDPTPEQIAGTARRGEGNSGLYQLCGKLRRERVIAEYFNWNGTRAGKLIASEPPPLTKGIADFIHAHVQTYAADRVAIVGNSWGGLTALDVSRELLKSETPIALDCVIFLDPSSVARGWGKPQSLPVNINRATNYFTRNTFVWGALPAEKRLINIDLGDPIHGYTRDGEPAYHSPFDIRAHIAAEWDDRIHTDITHRLLELVPRE